MIISSPSPSLDLRLSTPPGPFAFLANSSSSAATMNYNYFPGSVLVQRHEGKSASSSFARPFAVPPRTEFCPLPRYCSRARMGWTVTRFCPTSSLGTSVLVAAPRYPRTWSLTILPAVFPEGRLLVCTPSCASTRQICGSCGVFLRRCVTLRDQYSLRIVYTSKTQTVSISPRWV